MTPLVVVNFEKSSENIPKLFLVSTLVGKSVVAKKIYIKCPIIVLHKVMLANLIELDMVDFDLILSMDCLHSCYASIDCCTRVVKFQFPNEPIFEWSGNSVSPKSLFISYLKDINFISNGCIYHLVLVKDTKSETPIIQSIQVVNEFPDIFLKYLLGVPPIER